MAIAATPPHLAAVLAACIDLLLTAEAGTEWGPEELNAAFQWCRTLRQLAADSRAAAALARALQASWLWSASTCGPTSVGACWGGWLL